MDKLRRNCMPSTANKLHFHNYKKILYPFLWNVSNKEDTHVASELFRLLTKQYAGRSIVIVLDNARYQRCKLVEALAMELGITLQFLPSYSPNLNLIERLWKFVKKTCLSNQYDETFDDFKAGINDYLDRVETDDKSELATLMQLNFQNLNNTN